VKPDGVTGRNFPWVSEDVITLGHGSGGRRSRELLEHVLLPALGNPMLDLLEDSGCMTLPGGPRLAMTTDSFVITPLFFPGGDIGMLAVHGTLNDLAVSGATPIALSLALMLEEGLPLEVLRRIVASIAAAASQAGVPVITGDTKIVPRGSVDKVFVTTTGLGLLASEVHLGAQYVEPGDAVLVSGTIADHGVAILSCRDGLALTTTLESDTAPLHELTSSLLSDCRGVHAMRDPTRGGLAATLVEIASSRRLGIEIDEASVPVDERVRAICDMAGLDPWLMANEGKLVVFVAESQSDVALEILRRHPLGQHAARIGGVTTNHPGRVTAKTPLGTLRAVDLPVHEPLPRIC
jgi:hydrogenase expression/formation protein HypE